MMRSPWAHEHFGAVYDVDSSSGVRYATSLQVECRP